MKKIGLLFFISLRLSANDFQNQLKELFKLEKNQAGKLTDCSKLILSKNKIKEEIYLMECLALKLYFIPEKVPSDDIIQFCQKDKFQKDFSDASERAGAFAKLSKIEDDKKEWIKLSEWALYNSFKFQSICGGKIAKALLPENLVDQTGAPPLASTGPSSINDSHLHEDNSSRGPAIPAQKDNGNAGLQK